MTLRIPPPESSDKGENTADRFLSVHFTILKTKLPLAEKVVYALIASWQDRTCFYSHDYFAEILSCSKRKAQEVVTALAKKGLIQVIPRSGDTNVYKALPWQDLLPLPTETLAESATPPSRICHPPTQDLLPPLAESATYKNIYKINNKIIDKNTVADAPTPTSKYSLILEEPQESEVVQKSESLEKPIEVSEAPPISAAPPKTTRKSRKEAEVPFPPAEYWQGVTPSLVKWAIDNGVAELVAQKWVAKKIDDMADSAAAKGYRFIDWAAAFRKWYRKELPKEDGLEADLRKAAQHVFSTAKGNDGEKPVPQSVVWPAINKAIKALGGKEYLAGLANTSEEWKDKKLTELKKFARDHLEGA